MGFLTVVFLHEEIKMMKNGEDKRSGKKNKREIPSPLDGDCAQRFPLEWHVEGLL